MSPVDFTMTDLGVRPPTYAATGAYECIVYVSLDLLTSDVLATLSATLGQSGVHPATISYCPVALPENADWCKAKRVTGWYAWGYRV